MTDQYDEFIEYMGTSLNVDGFLKDFNGSEDPNVKVGSRRNLEVLIRNTVPHMGINVRSPDSLVSDAGLRVGKRYDRLAFEKFSENRAALIDEVSGVSADKFKERYLIINPYEISGDEEHNNVAKMHKNLKGLSETVQKYTGPKNMNHAQFLGETISYIEKDVKQLLGNDPEKLGELALAAYSTASPAEAQSVARYVVSGIVGRINAAVPEDKRVEYVVKTLKARAGSSEEKDARVAAKDLFYLNA